MRPDGFDYDKAIEEAKKEQESSDIARFLVAVPVALFVMYLEYKFLKWFASIIDPSFLMILIFIVCMIVSLILPMLVLAFILMGPETVSYTHL